MTEPTQADKERARKIAGPCIYAPTSDYTEQRCNEKTPCAWCRSAHDLACEIAAARDEGRAECKAPTGHIIDDQGVVRKVLGTLPVTADGCVVGVDANAFWMNAAGHVYDERTSDRIRVNNGISLPPEDLYSNREAALAAKGGA